MNTYPLTIEQTAEVRKIIRDEISAHSALWVQRLVHEEVDRQLGKCAPIQWRPKPSPKSDLERAAEIAERGVQWAEKYGHQSGEAFKEGYRNGCAYCFGCIKGLKPSPDWRKIAGWLARAVHVQRETIAGIKTHPADEYAREALAAYDAAVKEEQT